MSMYQRGKMVILVMFLLAVGLSGYAWWHRFQQNPMCKEFWGPEAILVIHQAPKVEFFSLEPDATSTTRDQSVIGDFLDIDGKAYLADHRDIADAPGLAHARHALIDDN